MKITQDHTGRFTGMADCYARCRPDYPPAALDFIIQHCHLKAGSVLVDIGCGTGISSRLFVARGLQVIGIEPNADMRGRAETENRPLLDYRPGTAENTGLPAASAEVVLAAQAFHWFDPEPTLKEMHRILKPKGWVVLMWNERDERDPFTAAYGDVVRSTPEAVGLERKRHQGVKPLLASSLFTEATCAVFEHQQPLDEMGLLGRAFSVSYAPREPAQVAKFKADLWAVFAPFQHNGQVTLHYQTAVYTAQRIGKE